MAKKAKKKPPPKAKPSRSPVRKPVASKSKGNTNLKRKSKLKSVTTEVTVPLILDKPDESSLGYLRVMGGQYYATSLNQCSLADMANHPVFSAVSLKTLANWSKADTWTLKRQQFQDSVRAKVQNAILNDLVKYRSEQLKNLQDLFDKALKKILEKVDELVLDEKNLPQYISAITKLGDLLDRWRSSLGESITPAMSFDSEPATDSTALPIKPQLSENESRHMAKMLIDMRRVRMREMAEQNAKEREARKQGS